MYAHQHIIQNDNHDTNTVALDLSPSARCRDSSSYTNNSAFSREQRASIYCQQNLNGEKNHPFTYHSDCCGGQTLDDSYQKPSSFQATHTARECGSLTAECRPQCGGVSNSNNKLCKQHGRCHHYSSTDHSISCQVKTCCGIPAATPWQSPIQHTPAAGTTCLAHSILGKGKKPAVNNATSEEKNDQPLIEHATYPSRTETTQADISPLNVRYHGLLTVTKIRSAKPYPSVRVITAASGCESDFHLLQTNDNFQSSHLKETFVDRHCSDNSCFTCNSKLLPPKAHENQRNKNRISPLSFDWILNNCFKTTPERENDEPQDLSLKNESTNLEHQTDASVSVATIQNTALSTAEKLYTDLPGQCNLEKTTNGKPAAVYTHQMTLSTIPELSSQSSAIPDAARDQTTQLSDTEEDPAVVTDLANKVPNFLLTNSSECEPLCCQGYGQVPCCPVLSLDGGEHKLGWTCEDGSPLQRADNFRASLEDSSPENVQMACPENVSDQIMACQPAQDCPCATSSTKVSTKECPVSPRTNTTPEIERSNSFPSLLSPVTTVPRKENCHNSLPVEREGGLSQHTSHRDTERVKHEVHLQSKNWSKRRFRPRRFHCHLCTVTCGNWGQLRGHLRTHTGERPYLCQEPGCQKSFVRNEELTRHRRIHSGERPYACRLCARSFMRKDHLNKHCRVHGASCQDGK